MTPISRILCAVDFSDGSRHALDHAAALAKCYDATVAVLYVHRTSVPVPAAGYMGVLQPSPLTDAERAQIVASLSDFVADDRKAGISIDALFEEDLGVPRAIVACASQIQADVIVLGTHGHSGLNRLVLGSVANTVMKTAGIPVFIVPPRARDAVPVCFHRILCPVDFSEMSRRALDFAVSLAKKSEARMTVAHVIELPADVSGPAAAQFAAYRTDRFEQARRCLTHLTSNLAATVAFDELLLVGKPYREILRLAADQQADVIVMAVQGRGALDLLAFGSTTHHVVRRATCPVLTVPAG